MVACCICAEDQLTSAFQQVATTCCHRLSVCDQCMTRHIKAEIEENREVSAVPCPAASCKQPMDDSDISKFGKADVERRHRNQIYQTPAEGS